MAAACNRAPGEGGRRAGAARAALPVAVAVALVWLILAAAQARAASIYRVNTLADSLPSAAECEGAPSDCSLRQALDLAQSGDTVLVPASASPYVIAHRSIPVRGGVTVEGAGDAATTLDGGGANQAFEVLAGGPVAVSGMTITHTYNGTGEDEGGAITGVGEVALTLDDVTVSDSESPTGYGGAIEVREGRVTIDHSRFVDDVASGTPAQGAGGGGAIEVESSVEHPGQPASLAISDSVFLDDTATQAGGGAVQAENKDSVTVTSSTFSGDVAEEGEPGGAIALYTGATASIVNSTFTGDAAGLGGAIYTEAESLSLVGDTLAGNAAEVGSNLAARTGQPHTTLENTILATPLGGRQGGGGEPAAPENCSGKIISEGHNLEDTAQSTCSLGAPGDIIGESPQLGPLANNSSLDPTAGGPPQTLALAADSPAVAAGDPGACASQGSVDERGFPRPGIAQGACDIGAYELLPAVPTRTTLAASAASEGYGQPLTLTAAVLPGRSLSAAVPLPGASVEFLYDGIDLGSAPLGAGGWASLTTAAIPAGAHALTAIYRGDAVYAPSSSAAIAEQVTAAPQAPPAPAGPAPAPGAPALSDLRQRHGLWREGARLASVAARRRSVPVGTAFAFSLDARATLTLTFARVVAGRLSHGRCVVQTPRNRRHGRCRRSTDAGSVSFAGVAAGSRSISFDGRLARTRWLVPGRYTVTIVASDATGRSAAAVLAFTIVRG